MLATRLTTPVRAALLAGRKVVLIANSADALIDPQRDLPLNDRHNFPSMLLRERAGTPWDGQWMGAFSWRRTEGPWSALPGGPMLDEHWTGLIPNHVLTGFPSTAFGGLVDSGMAVGWLHLAAAFVKRSFLGKAWLTVSTFDLTLPGARKSARAASYEGAGGELSDVLSRRRMRCSRWEKNRLAAQRARRYKFRKSFSYRSARCGRRAFEWEKRQNGRSR